MDPQRALYLARTGGCILCLDVPFGTEVGIDCLAFETGKQFKGIKMIPPGVHIFYYSTKANAVRTSMLIRIEPASVIILRWAADVEQFRLMPHDDDESVRLSAAARRFEFDQNLGPYPTDQLGKWKLLSTHITANVIDRVQPVGGIIHADTDAAFARAAFGATTPATPTLYFSAVAGCGRGSKPEHRTRYAIDTSYSLIRLVCDILKKEGAVAGEAVVREQILGELQLSFVLFLIGQSFVALEQWKRLVDVVCRAEDVLLRKYQPQDAAADDGSSPTRSGSSSASAVSFTSTAIRLLGRSFWCEAFAVIRNQMGELPKDILAAELSADNFLLTTLSALKRTMHIASSLSSEAAASREQQAPICDSAVRAEAERMLSTCRDTFGWEPSLTPVTGPSVPPPEQRSSQQAASTLSSAAAAASATGSGAMDVDGSGTQDDDVLEVDDAVTAAVNRGINPTTSYEVDDDDGDVSDDDDAETKTKGRATGAAGDGAASTTSSRHHSALAVQPSSASGIAPAAQSQGLSTDGYASMEELLAALAADGGDGDLPVIV